jgi:molybdate transport system permease protein
MSFRRGVIFTAVGIFLFYALLILSLFYFLNAKDFVQILLSPRTIYSIKLSLFVGAGATFLAVAIAVPAAYALSRYNFVGKTIVDTFLELPMIVSPIALGAIILIFFSTKYGTSLKDYFVFEIPGILLAQFVTVLGIATRLIKSVFDEISPRYEAVARSLGATPFNSFRLVSLPLAYKGILAAAILCFAKSIGEFGATITVAGSMAMKTETLPIAIFSKLSTADIEGTVVLIMTLLFIGLSVLYLIRLIGGGKRAGY